MNAWPTATEPSKKNAISIGQHPIPARVKPGRKEAGKMRKDKVELRAPGTHIARGWAPATPGRDIMAAPAVAGHHDRLARWRTHIHTHTHTHTHTHADETVDEHET